MPITALPNDADGVRTFLSHLYDPNFIKNNYVSKNDCVYRIDHERGELIPVTRTFRDSFEGVTTASPLIAPERWHASTADPAPPRSRPTPSPA